MANFSISKAEAKAALDAGAALLDAGTGTVAAVVKLYAGTMNARVDDGLPGGAVELSSHLATIPGSGGIFNAAADAGSDASQTAQAFAGGTWLADGTVSFFVAYDRDGVAVRQGDVGTSNATMLISDTNAQLGGTVSIVSWVCSQPTLNLG